MSKLKILVVEDEVIIADNICDTLEDLGYEVTEPAINYTEALVLIEQEKPDIAILDIQLSGRKTGIDIAKKIRESYNFPFIFLTSNADQMTINEAKEVMPPAYLIKPFTKDELYSAIEITLSNFTKKTEMKEDENSSNNNIFVKVKGVYKRIILEEIVYLKSDHVYVEILLKSGEKLVVRKSLNEFDEALNNHFLRVHRSYIVNFKYINQVNNSTISILQEEIPIGKKYKEEVLKRLNLI